MKLMNNANYGAIIPANTRYLRYYALIGYVGCIK
jgi:hypothetical protein